LCLAPLEEETPAEDVVGVAEELIWLVDVVVVVATSAPFVVVVVAARALGAEEEGSTWSGVATGNRKKKGKMGTSVFLDSIMLDIHDEPFQSLLPS
jgi:hypothetical protein